MNILRNNDNRIILLCLLKTSRTLLRKIIRTLFHCLTITNRLESTPCVFLQTCICSMEKLLGHYIIPNSKVKCHVRLSPQFTQSSLVSSSYCENINEIGPNKSYHRKLSHYFFFKRFC